MKTRPLLPTLFAAALLATSGLVFAQQQGAEASLAATQGNNASGNVRFTKAGDGVKVEARLTGLAPGGHGFHIHEKGDCSAPDATSAGGHFNPSGKPHGHPDKAEHHLGDLPMLEADAGGQATYSGTLKGLSIGGDGAGNIVGRAVVVHAAPDDYSTQPTGNSGGRVACGVIVAK